MTLNDKQLLEYVAPYLPYGLNYKALSGKISKLNSVDSELKYVNFGWGDADSLLDIKPILLPLSDLTKPCLEGGKVPIEELAKINDSYLTSNCNNYVEDWREVMTDIERFQFNCEYVHKTGNMGDLVYQFSYWEKLQRFSFKDTTRNRSMAVSHQLTLFQQLFKWHFDVFGLIEKGYALDINDIKG